MKSRNHIWPIVLLLGTLLLQIFLPQIHTVSAEFQIALTSTIWIASFFFLSLNRENHLREVHAEYERRLIDSAAQKEEHLVESVTGKVENTLSKLEITALKVFPDSSAALKYLAGRMPSVKCLRSTGIITKGADSFDLADVPDLYIHTNAIKTALNRIDLSFLFEEVITPDLAPRAEEYKKSVRIGQSTYRLSLVERSTSPFINFSVLEYEFGKKEVVFGWVITELGRFQGKCFQSNNPDLIAMFCEIHNVLSTKGKMSAGA